MEIKLSRIQHAFHFPRLDWHSVRVWVEEHIDKPEQSAAWREIVIQWLETLNNVLNDRYQIDPGTDVTVSAQGQLNNLGLTKYSDVAAVQIVFTQPA